MNHVYKILREPIVRVVIRAGVVLLALHLFYSHLDPRDIKTILLCLFADAGLQAIPKNENT